MRRRPLDRQFVVAAVLAVLIAIAYIVAERALLTLSESSDPDDIEQVAAGRSLYLEHCSFCHRSELQGQPNWRTPLPSGGYPAPPLGATGRAWQLSDRDLFDMIKFGGGFFTPDRPNGMPGFEEQLSDGEIRAILAFVKSHWTEDQRARQPAAGAP